MSSEAIETRVLQAVRRLRTDDEHVIELRGLDVPNGYRGTMTVAGWFDDIELLAKAAAKLDQLGGQVYTTLNPVQPALLCRGYNRVAERPKATTSDGDIVRRVWIPFDIDPVRPAGVSSSSAELASAKVRAIEVAAWLRGKLEESPSVWACSGNGCHLLFRTDLPNDDKSTALVKNLITQASGQFSDNSVKIDTTVFNAARIWRLYGTTNRKGDNVPKLDRIHRVATILGEGFAE